MRYCQSPEADYPILRMDGEIGVDPETNLGIDGSVFAQELLALQDMGKTACCIWINSVGGSVQDGYNIATAILKTTMKVDTLCSGMAASMAAVLFQLGRKRIMMDYAILMYHNPYSAEPGSQPTVDAMRDSLNLIVAKKSGMNPETVQKMFNAETFLDAMEARMLNLCDEIEQTVELNRKRMTAAAAGGAKSYWKVASSITNSILETKIQPHFMKSVTALLGLNEAASEVSITAAVQSVMNKSKEELDSMKDKIKKAQDDLEEMTGKYEKACKDADDSKKEAKDAKDKEEAAVAASAKAKAEILVKAHVKSGRIMASVEAKFTALATADYEGTKAMLEGIAVNAKAVRVETVNATTSSDPSRYASESVAAISARKQIEVTSRKV